MSSDPTPIPQDLGPTDWMSRGACIKNPEVFTGEKPDKRIWYPLCRACPVIDTCLLFAIENKEKGIWGGTTEKERGKLPKDYLRVLGLSRQSQPEAHSTTNHSAMEQLVEQARVQAQERTKELSQSLSALLLELQDIS